MMRHGIYSLKGATHFDEGSECQDFIISEKLYETVILIAADGAGSSSNGKKGAQSICENVLNDIKKISKNILERPATNENHIKKVIKNSIQKTRKNILLGPNEKNDKYTIIDLSKVSYWYKIPKDPIKYQLPIKLNDYASTFILAILGLNECLCFHIGDGRIYGFNYLKDKDLDNFNFSQTISSQPENGEYANQTYFFTDENWEDHLRVFSFNERIDALMIFTDGADPFLVSKDQLNSNKEIVNQIFNILKKDESINISQFLLDAFPIHKVHKVSSDDVSIGLAIL